jgi:phosphatidylglycerophosphate synthase
VTADVDGPPLDKAVGGAVVSIGVGLTGGLAALTTVIAALAASVGLTPPGWSMGLLCGVVLTAAVRLGMARSGARDLGPADLVTLTRATLACGVAGLVVDAFLARPAVAAVVWVAAVALVLDAVDGWVARWTRTSSAFGARFDGEVDAFLILVLSVYVSRSAGAWVLVLGLARYAFAVAGWVLPWMRGRLPYRYWRKVVTAVQGVVLTVAASGALPTWVTTAALLVAFELLAESFGRDVLWLWRRRPRAPAGESAGESDGDSDGEYSSAALIRVSGPPRRRVP